MRRLFLLGFLHFFTLACNKNDPSNYSSGNNGDNVTTLVIAAIADSQAETVNINGSRALTAEGFFYTIEGPDSYSKSGTLGIEAIKETVAAGDYTVDIYSLEDYESKLPDFGTVVYGARETKNVTANGTTKFNLVCRQINTGIKFVFDQSVIDYYGNDLTATVAQDGTKIITYSQGDIAKTAYFMPGDVVLTLKDGADHVPIGGEASKTLTFKANQLWTVTFKTSLSTNINMMSVDVDPEVNE